MILKENQKEKKIQVCESERVIYEYECLNEIHFYTVRLALIYFIQTGKVTEFLKPISL
jgi:hypothetical protein